MALGDARPPADREAHEHEPAAPLLAPRALLELRVHGVSGTPPAQILGDPHPRRVAGNDDSGFWRRAGLRNHEREATGPTGDVLLEAYSWGGLTSGRPSRAAWVLLAPFALANTAAAMQPTREPPASRRSIARGAAGTILRWFALSLTVTLVLAAYLVGLDLVAWQCGAQAACSGGHAVTAFLGWDVFAEPGTRLAILLVVPLVVLGVLWLLGRASWQRTERYVPPVAPVAPVAPAGGAEHGGTAFDAPTFWDGRARVLLLRRLHVAAVLGALAALTARVVVSGAAAGVDRTVASGLQWAGVAIVVLALGLAAPDVRVSPAPRRDAAARVAVALGWLSVAGVVALLVGLGPADLEPAPSLPGVGTALTWLFTSQLLGVGAVFGLAVRDRTTVADDAGVRLGGVGSAAVVLVALVLGVAFSAAVIVQAANFLGDPAVSGEHAAPIVLPTAVVWAARAVGLAAVPLLLTVAAVGAVAVRAARRRRARGIVAPDPPAAPADPRVRHAVDTARLPDDLEPAAVAAVIGLAVVTVVTTVVALADELDVDAAHDVEQWLLDHFAGNGFTQLGTWLITAFGVGLFLVARASFRSTALRRRVGILWDVATFWPRSAHPLAPPCYGERVVPELIARLAHHRYSPEAHDADCDDEGGAPRRVVVAAHSQGSVIAAAALLQLGATDGLALVTYGSPVQRLYGRFFPAYWSTEVLRTLDARLGGRWWNLWRATDPIGGPVGVLGAGRDREVAVRGGRACGDTVDRAIEAHSNYTATPEYHDALAGAAVALGAGDLAAGATPPEMAS